MIKEKTQRKFLFLWWLFYHDLMNKFAAVVGYLYLKKIQEAEEALENMGDLITLYNKFMSVDCEETMPLGQIIEEATKMMTKKINITIKNPEMEFDSLFIPIFYNLIGNSDEHSGKDNVSIEIEAKEKEIIVTDNGKGIEDKNIFIPGHALGIIKILGMNVLNFWIKETGIPGEGVCFEIKFC